MHTRTVAPLFVLALALPASGCIKAALINGQIQGTREGSAAFDTIGDWELAERAAANGVAQFEGMHLLAPDNEDALFLLAKGWTGYAFGFAEDVMEDAEDSGDRELTAYHKDRAAKAYGRGVAYGLELLAKRAGGFDEAKKSEPELKTWLAKSFTTKDDAANLFWTGYAWVGRTNLLKDDAEAVANLWIGVALLERSVELDPAYNSYSGLVVLGSYHARTAAAEMDQAKQELETAIEKTGGKSLLPKLQYAIKYACAKVDLALYTKLLNEIVAAEDSVPELRLTNAIAKRRARRWLGEKRMFDMCSLEREAAPGS